LPSLVVLMIEAEQPEGLSARKLVVETAKHNVLTAYSLDSGLDLLKRFPKVDAIFVHGAILAQAPDILAVIRQHEPGIPIILATPFANVRSPDADYVIDTHHPQDLLRVLTTEIERRP
jgi:two-component SAPR family response regulator